MAQTAIEWATHVENPFTGCDRVSPADFRAWRPWADDYGGPGLDLEEIDWLIVGGESGSGHRRFDWDWARALRDCCRDDCWQGEREGMTAFFVKQGGGHRPGDKLEDLPPDLRIREFPQVAHA